MTTLTIEVLNKKALRLLKDLEQLDIIRVRKHKSSNHATPNHRIAGYKGAMKAQTMDEINQQLEDLRNEWQ
ncbi:hypothetical protein GCM10023231_33830 [Olivibacter ginsenosidimutans]|uniref:Uncharacterized protein n=1 Tax=Olivibacter ginsenosidimutans TaxID=1176537 RepID=A0ABP9BYF1_9SPHI